MWSSLGEYALSKEFQKTWASINHSGSFPFFAPVPANNAFACIGGKGDIHATTNSYHLALLQYFLGTGTGKFFDWGCGIGNIVIRAASMGWETYGCDISKDCIEISNKNIQAARSFYYDTRTYLKEDAAAKVVQGNFFNIPGFNEKWLEGKTEYILTPILDSCPDCNPYTALGIDPSEIDVFFHHQAVPLSPLLSLFNRVAKPGAMFIYVRRLDDIEIEKFDACCLSNNQSGLYVYTKS